MIEIVKERDKNLFDILNKADNQEEIQKQIKQYLKANFKTSPKSKGIGNKLYFIQIRYFSNREISTKKSFTQG